MTTVSAVVGISSEDIEVHLEKGRILLSQGNYNDALTHYQAAVEADKTNYLTYYKRATVLLALGRHKSALDDLNEVIHLKPDFLAARGQRGALLFKQGKLDEAHIDLEFVLRVDPYDAEATHFYTLIDPTRRNIENAYMFFEDHQWPYAVDLLTQILTEVPWDIKLREMRAEAYEKSGDLLGAISDLRATSKMRPDNTNAILKLSKLHFILGEPEESLMSIRECLKLDPDHKECFAHYKKVKKIAAQVSLMHEFSKNSKYEDCVDKANAALKQKDNISPAIKHLILATKCHCLNKVSFLLSDVSEIMTNLSISYTEQNGESSEAIETCSAALETNEHDVNVLCDRAEAHINNEDYDEGE
jgi:DnaJ family protein C protein 3